MKRLVILALALALLVGCAPRGGRESGEARVTTRAAQTRSSESTIDAPTKEAPTKDAPTNEAPTPETPAPTRARVEEAGDTVQTRFVPPEGYSRVEAPEGSFARYLQTLPLKPAGSPVLYHDGREKSPYAYIAVVDQPIGERDLQQCADAIMRLKAEYHYARGEHSKIGFHFVDGFFCDWDTWRSGHRVQAGERSSKWITKGSADDSYENFLKYMNVVFAYASTRSLEKELTPVENDTVRIGDVFIKGGSPGHAIIVVDAAESASGQRVFLLAQSYMPAQETQILRNYNDESLDPWYSAENLFPLHTPEWMFEEGAHRRFPDE